MEPHLLLHRPLEPNDKLSNLHAGIRVVMLAQLGLAAVALGPSRALKLSLQAIMAASAGRTVLVLAQTLPQKVLSSTKSTDYPV